MSRLNPYGVRQLADGMRAVRRNTMLIAEDICVAPSNDPCVIQPIPTF
jgi:hypothetical protein